MRRRAVQTALLGLLVVFALPVRGQTNDGPNASAASDQTLAEADRLTRLGVEALWRGDLSSSEDLLNRSLVIGQKFAPNGSHVAATLQSLGTLALKQGNVRRAEERFRQALAIRERLAPDSLDVAATLSALGTAADERGDLIAAQQYLDRALGIQKKLAPESNQVAATLVDLGLLASGKGDLPGSEQYLRRALAIQERLAPGTYACATTLEVLGLVAAERGDLAAAEQAYRRSLEIRERIAPGDLQVARSLTYLGDIVKERGDLGEAERSHLRALAIREKISAGSTEVANSLTALGNIAHSRGNFTAAEDYYRRALTIYEKVAPESPSVAIALSSLGMLAGTREDLPAAEQAYRRALTIWEKLAPRSPQVAFATEALGRIARQRGDLVRAEENYLRALSIGEQIRSGSVDVVGSLYGLADVATARGDLASAEEYLHRVVAVREAAAPASLEVAEGLEALAGVAIARGELASAEDNYERALAIRERLAPGSLKVAESFNNLGIMAAGRHDLAGADERVQRALVIEERIAPGSFRAAGSLALLGSFAMQRGDLQAAEGYGREALSIYEAAAPGSSYVALSLVGLGALAYLGGHHHMAEDLMRQALEVQQKRAPESLDVASVLSMLGGLASRRDDWVASESYLRQALAIVQALAPGSSTHSNVLHGLGLAYRRGDKLELAAEYLCRAVDALEQQSAKLGGSDEVKAAFGAKHSDYYRLCLEAKLAIGQPGAALQILERSRARTLLAMLAERDLLFHLDVPADIMRERQLADTDYDRVQAAIAQLNPQRDAAKLKEHLGRLRELRQKQEEIVSKIRRLSPHFASLRYPQPLDLTGVRDTLDVGTVLLSYSVGEQRTILFVIEALKTTPPELSGLSVLVLPIGEKDLRERVEAFRNLIGRSGSHDNKSQTALASGLYDVLIRPAEPMITSSQRVLISPDGPLHLLPFAALIRNEPSAWHYFVEWKPIHTVVSATVYAEIRSARRTPDTKPRSLVLEAFGDPLYPRLVGQGAAIVENPEVRSLAKRGLALDPLPAARQEVEGIAAMFGDRAVSYLGADATEERVKAIGRDVRYIHFACHGLLDEGVPLNSALALTIPEKPGANQDNGLLQAWEIFEQLRINADLVTLSACETGLGTEMGGEGLIGLTRAFQYAGARSVLASLWSVADESTAELMNRFYGYLKAGKTKDEALRAAQMDLIRGSAGNRRSLDLSQPFHWAAFELTGDFQ